MCVCWLRTVALTNTDSNKIRLEERHAADFGLVFDADKILCDLATGFQQLTVFSTESLGNVMFLDGLVMVTERDDPYYHESIVHPTAMRTGSLARCLVIGGGDGGTAREIAAYDGCKSIDLCEIDDAVVKAARQFFPAMAAGLNHTKTNVIIDDGCAFVARTADDLYDFIVIDSSEPIGPNGTLFTPEFYENIRRILAPEGHVVIQGGSTMWQQEELQNISGKLNSIFPYASHYIGLTPTYPGGHWTFFVCGEIAPVESALRSLPVGRNWISEKSAKALLDLQLPF